MYIKYFLSSVHFPLWYLYLLYYKSHSKKDILACLWISCHPDKDQKKDDDLLWLGYLAPESDVTVDCFPALLIPFSCSLPVHQAERKTWSLLPLHASGKFISGMFHLLTVWPYPSVNNEPHTSQDSFLKFLISQNPVYCLDKVSVLVLIPFMPLGMYQMVFISIYQLQKISSTEKVFCLFMPTKFEIVYIILWQQNLIMVTSLILMKIFLTSWAIFPFWEVIFFGKPLHSSWVNFCISTHNLDFVAYSSEKKAS